MRSGRRAPRRPHTCWGRALASSSLPVLEEVPDLVDHFTRDHVADDTQARTCSATAT
ncbi:hypothetical protein [Streptomyces djakartensis]|uniref:hypothetical protein n=1 Tax=Streptomyces djakartensis TaxID=68193 RepID=UPI0034DEEDB4